GFRRHLPSQPARPASPCACAARPASRRRGPGGAPRLVQPARARRGKGPLTAARAGLRLARGVLVARSRLLPREERRAPPLGSSPGVGAVSVEEVGGPRPFPQVSRLGPGHAGGPRHPLGVCSVRRVPTRKPQPARGGQQGGDGPSGRPWPAGLFRCSCWYRTYEGTKCWAPLRTALQEPAKDGGDHAGDKAPLSISVSVGLRIQRLRKLPLALAGLSWFLSLLPQNVLSATLLHL
ncbi:hypothetical protein MC885_013995, partial [Smutsia gigantea]